MIKARSRVPPRAARPSSQGLCGRFRDWCAKLIYCRAKEKRVKRAIQMYLASVLLLTGAGAHPQSPVPCADPPYRQFDFWLGDWDVVEVERPTTVVARARIELILNACVIHEVYEAMDGHKGESFSIYDATRHTWHQSWVNDHGYLLTIEGGIQGGAMIL